MNSLSKSMGLFSGKKEVIQPKLSINRPGDEYEQEADAMAEKVMSMPANGTDFTPKTGIIGASIQRKCAACEEEEKQKKIMRKETGGLGGSVVSNSFSSTLNSTKGGGTTLPQSTRGFMENAFSTDFTNVRIHNDSQANQMSQSINAKAFTHGNDIYFGAGQYAPNTYSGKSLLAHELTHTVQQNGHGITNFLQKQDVENISTPVPDDFDVNHDRRQRVTSATGIISGVNITLLPDRRGRVPRGSSGATRNSIRIRPPRATYSRGRRPIVSRIRPANISISIRTTYRPRVNPTVTSGYGRGTTAADQSAGNTSLRFHEGSHGTKVLDFLRENPLPLFTGSTGMTRAQFNSSVRTFMREMREYTRLLEEANIQEVDCVGNEASFCEN